MRRARAVPAAVESPSPTAHTAAATCDRSGGGTAPSATEPPDAPPPRQPARTTSRPATASAGTGRIERRTSAQGRRPRLGRRRYGAAMDSRALLRRALALPALLVGGIVVGVAADRDTAGTAVGLTLAGLAGILLVALAFYEVGRSEDRARARERRRDR